jgi:CelD/BcsL family acetyltransferase involved in cellulose biosynthesis
VHGSLESLLRSEWRPLTELASIADQWQALAGRSLEPNVFYEPAFALPAAPVFGADTGAVLVWSRSATPQLLGFFPATVERRRYGVWPSVLVGWTHPYAPFGAPLIDCDNADAVLAAWLAHLAGDARLPGLVLLPYLPLQGPLAAALEAALARHGCSSAVFASHTRALLQPADERASYLDRAVSHKQRRELRRKRKRLAEEGTLHTERTTEVRAVAQALGDFLVLEDAGWKGRARTAARRHPDISRFMQDAVTGLAGAGQAQVYRLTFDARPIAAAIVLRSGASAWGWKIAFDEAFARSSPGVQLVLDLTQALLDDVQIVRADSCATADYPMADSIWRERLAIGDRLIAMRGTPFALACMLERTRRAGVAGAKRLHDLPVRR